MAELTAFAKNLKKFREERQLSQKRLAETLGVSAQTISAYEKGSGEKGKNPSLERVIDIADTLNVSLDALCGRDFRPANKERTLGDVASLLCEMWEWVTVTITTQEVNRRTEIGDMAHTFNDAAPAIFFDSGSLRRFLEDYAKLRQLHKEKTIDDKMFNDWISLKIKDLDSISIASQLTNFCDADIDDDLPF